MSLLDAFYSDYHIMNKAKVDDGEGGWESVWTAGATIQAALDNPTQTQRLIAEQRKVQEIRNAVFPEGTPIDSGDYIQSVDDESLVYLVQSNPQTAPGVSSIPIMHAEVVKTRLPK